MTPKIQLVGAFAIVMSACIHSHASDTIPSRSIGINFMASAWGGGPFPIAADAEAGFIPQVNWNNVSPVVDGSTDDVASPMAGKLVDNAGIDSGVSLAWINANNNVGTNGGNTTPNEQLYRAVVEGPWFKSPSPQLEFTITDIPFETYDVYAYLAGFSFAAEASARIGNEEYFYEQSSNFTTDGFILATGMNANTPPLATYARFEGLTNDAFTLEIIKQDGNRGGLAGVQIVEVPEPSTLTMLFAAVISISFFRRHKNRATVLPCD